MVPEPDEKLALVSLPNPTMLNVHAKTGERLETDRRPEVRFWLLRSIFAFPRREGLAFDCVNEKSTEVIISLSSLFSCIWRFRFAGIVAVVERLDAMRASALI